MYDFYTKSNEASLILKKIKRDIKLSVNKKICSRQIKAAKLGIRANQSLIKAFQIAGNETLNSSIKANQKRYESLLKDCKNFNKFSKVKKSILCKKISFLLFL